MKVLSMIQPWASLFLLDEAHYETRIWRTHYLGPLVIHTSRKVDKSFCRHPLIQELLRQHGLTTEMLPTGKIIGTCNMVNCLKVIDCNEGHAVLEDGSFVTGKDYFIGGYGIGNYAWEVTGKKLLKEYIPAKGQLGLWEHKLSQKELE